MGNNHDGCCSHDHQQSESKSTDGSAPIPEGHIKDVFSVSGMDCADEIKAIQNALAGKRISRVDANLMAAKVTVSHDQEISREEIERLINAAGVRVVGEAPESFWGGNARRVQLVVTSGVLLGLGLTVDYLHGELSYTTTALYFLSALAGAAIVFPKAYRALIRFNLDMNVLMTLAVLGAFVIKQYSEAASVVFLFSLAELLEAFSVARARRAISGVLNLTAQFGLGPIWWTQQECVIWRPQCAAKRDKEEVLRMSSRPKLFG